MPTPQLNPRYWDTVKPDKDIKGETQLADVLEFIEEAEAEFQKKPEPAVAEDLKAYLTKFPSVANNVIKELDAKEDAQAVNALKSLQNLCKTRLKGIDADLEGGGEEEEEEEEKGPFKLKSNVGPGERNDAEDVKAVQRKLKLKDDGKLGKQTVDAILKFQEKFMKDGGTGVIEPGSETAKRLGKL